MSQISPDLRSATVDPAAPWRVHAARVTELRPEVANVTTYALRLVDDQTAARFRFGPGQFNMLYLPGVGEAAISISSDPDQPERLLHTIRAVGNVTQALARETVGGQVLLRGPFGSTWPLEQCFGDDLVLAAGGLGLAPLRPALHWVANRRHQFRRVCLVYGARTPRDLLYHWQFAEWRNAQIEVHTTVDLDDDDWCGAIGVVPSLMPALQLDPLRTWVMTCGPEVMMRFVVLESLKLGIPAARIYLSLERNMSCALGFCGHCQLGPAFVCRNGPVFSYPQMEPYLHVEDL